MTRSECRMTKGMSNEYNAFAAARVEDWGAYASRVWVVACRDDGIFCGKFAKAAEHLRQPPRPACSPEFRSRHGSLYKKLEPE